MPEAAAAREIFEETVLLPKQSPILCVRFFPDAAWFVAYNMRYYLRRAVSDGYENSEAAFLTWKPY
jgi:8-oxo-dGTP pyrophosphatase MutT (NUDIX family)